MSTSVLLAAFVCAAHALAQVTTTSPAASKPEQKAIRSPVGSQPQPVQTGSAGVVFDAKQPYRPLPGHPVQPRETIFEFYLKTLNPRQINWGERIDRRLAMLAEQSVLNPYFRFCALEMMLILILLLTCWVWWDKMHQIKWIAAECLTDALNAKRQADQKALEAIGRYNHHIEMCNRVIEKHGSGIPTGSDSDDWQREVHDLKTQLSAERAKSTTLTAQLKNREEIQTTLESRIQQLEKLMAERQDGASAELVARLQRAEAQLSAGKAGRS